MNTKNNSDNTSKSSDDNKNNLIEDALEYYDDMVENIDGLVRNIGAVRYDLLEKSKDIDRNIIIFYNSNREKVYESRFETLGFYISKYNLWTWAWGNPNYHKNNIDLSKKLLIYGLEIDPTENYFLKMELTTPRFLISNKIQLEIHIAIAAHLLKKKIFTYKNVIDEKGDYITHYIIFLD